MISRSITLGVHLASHPLRALAGLLVDGISQENLEMAATHLQGLSKVPMVGLSLQVRRLSGRSGASRKFLGRFLPITAADMRIAYARKMIRAS
jgi:hypothetical protein